MLNARRAQAQLISEQKRAAKLHEDNTLLMAKVDGLENELGGKSKQVRSPRTGKLLFALC
jgi:hypothetical protein